MPIPTPDCSGREPPISQADTPVGRPPDCHHRLRARGVPVLREACQEEDHSLPGRGTHPRSGCTDDEKSGRFCTAGSLDPLRSGAGDGNQVAISIAKPKFMQRAFAVPSPHTKTVRVRVSLPRLFALAANASAAKSSIGACLSPECAASRHRHAGRFHRHTAVVWTSSTVELDEQIVFRYTLS